MTLDQMMVFFFLAAWAAASATGLAESVKHLAALLMVIGAILAMFLVCITAVWASLCMLDGSWLGEDSDGAKRREPTYFKTENERK